MPNGIRQARTFGTVAAVLAFSLTAITPAWACLSCGCGGSGSSADMGAVSGTAGMFGLGRHWLFQQGLNLRMVTGSFNELGTWAPTPVGGSLQTLQASVGVNYFPIANVGIGITVPAAINALNKASWGPFGSVSPTDLPASVGGMLGDLTVQGSFKFWEAGPFAAATWGSLTLPTGQSTGDPSSLTGSGLWSGQLGLTGLGQWGDWEAIASVGGQAPLGSSPTQISTFAVGPSLLYQVQGSYRLTEAWRLGMTASGYVGSTLIPGDQPVGSIAAKLKLMPHVTFQWQPTLGVRAALGIDPMTLGRNSMTDATLLLTFFQYL
jgi:hypothetical protein